MDNNLTSNGVANSMDEIVTISMLNHTNTDKFNDTYQQAKHNDVIIPGVDDRRHICGQNEDSMECNLFINIFAQEDLLEDENYFE